VWEGSNKLIKTNDIVSEVQLIIEGKGKHGTVPKYWDGKTAERIVNLVENL
jgi:UDP-N-acetylglucosamine 2-epimerase (non-hydrolysing)